MTAGRRRRGGFAYVDALCATVLLALCLPPIASAVRNALDATRVAQTRMRELRCMEDKMETVLAEPYKKLWDAARGPGVATGYSAPADGRCMARNVTIAKYEHEWDKAPVFLPYPDDPHLAEKDLDKVLLYITVSSPDSGYSFTTLVRR